MNIAFHCGEHREVEGIHRHFDSESGVNVMGTIKKGHLKRLGEGTLNSRFKFIIVHLVHCVCLHCVSRLQIWLLLGGKMHWPSF